MAMPNPFDDAVDSALQAQKDEERRKQMEEDAAAAKAAAGATPPAGAPVGPDLPMADMPMPIDTGTDKSTQPVPDPVLPELGNGLMAPFDPASDKHAGPVKDGPAPTQGKDPNAPNYDPTALATTPPPAAASDKLAGGWQDFSQKGSHQNALGEALSQGLTGEAAVQYAAAHGAPGIAFYPGKNQYGLPNGFYAAPNPADPSKMDLIRRSPEGRKIPSSFAPLAGMGAGTALPMASASGGLMPSGLPASTPVQSDTDPFAAMGGGVRLPGGAWLPKSAVTPERAALMAMLSKKA